MFLLTWAYTVTDNPQRVICHSIKEAKNIKKCVKKELAYLGPFDFSCTELKNGTNITVIGTKEST